MTFRSKEDEEDEEGGGKKEEERGFDKEEKVRLSRDKKHIPGSFNVHTIVTLDVLKDGDEDDEEGGDDQVQVREIRLLIGHLPIVLCTHLCVSLHFSLPSPVSRRRRPTR